MNSFLQKIEASLMDFLTPQKIEKAQESCIFKIIMSGTMGFGIGGAMGLFLTSMSSNLTGPEADLMKGVSVGSSGGVSSTATATASTATATAKQIFKEMGSKTWKSAKGFGKVGALFAIFECPLEAYRGKHDHWNTAFAACMTGGTLGLNTGPQNALIGCASFAAFSLAIEKWMERVPKEEIE